MSIDTFTQEDSIDIAGYSFKPGDKIVIVGEFDKFTFIEKERNDRTGAEWVNVRASNGNRRSFHIEKIKIGKIVKKNGKLLTDVVCIDHPKYTARRKPRKPCFRCWEAYEANKK